MQLAMFMLEHANSVIDFVYIRSVGNNEAKRLIFPQIF